MTAAERCDACGWRYRIDGHAETCGDDLNDADSPLLPDGSMPDGSVADYRRSKAAEQLADDIHARIIAALTSLGWSDLAELARTRVDQAAERLAWQLTQDADDHLAAQTVIDLTGVLWDLDPDPDWWRTPVGRLVARSIGRDDTEAVTQHQAAAMLGVTRGTIAQLVARGTLDRHPDGGVLRASVLQRLLSRP